MTHVQELMLAVVFGCSVGTLIGNLITAAVDIVSMAKEKKRQKKED